MPQDIGTLIADTTYEPIAFETTKLAKYSVPPSNWAARFKGPFLSEEPKADPFEFQMHLWARKTPVVLFEGVPPVLDRTIPATVFYQQRFLNNHPAGIHWFFLKNSGSEVNNFWMLSHEWSENPIVHAESVHFTPMQGDSKPEVPLKNLLRGNHEAVRSTRRDPA